MEKKQQLVSMAFDFIARNTQQMFTDWLPDSFTE